MCNSSPPDEAGPERTSEDWMIRLCYHKGKSGGHLGFWGKPERRASFCASVSLWPRGRSLMADVDDLTAGLIVNGGHISALSDA
jgi:hypothetical protein